MNSPIAIHVLRTKRPRFAAVSAAVRCAVGRDADALDQSTLRELDRLA